MAAGQNAAALKVTRLNLPSGSSIRDLARNNADLSGAAATLGLQIDTVTPTVKSFVANPATASLNAAKVATLTVNFSEAVYVAGGTPALTLNDGRSAIYQSGSGSTALTFACTVQPGGSTPDLAVARVSLGAAIMQDEAGNDTVLTGAAVTPAGPLKIDTLAASEPVFVSSGTPARRRIIVLKAPRKHGSESRLTLI